MSISRPYPSKPNWGAANLVEFVYGLRGRIKNEFVSKTGDESIAGTKTFSSSPVVPTPAAGSDTNVPATTEWVNDAIDGVEDTIAALDANVVKLSGNQTVGGVKTFSDWMLAKGFYQSVANGSVVVGGGNGIGANDGAKLTLYGKSEATDPGEFKLLAGNATAYKILNGSPDGTLTWDSKEFVYISGAQTISGAKTFSATTTVQNNYPILVIDKVGDDNDANPSDIRFGIEGTAEAALRLNQKSLYIGVRAGTSAWYNGPQIGILNNGNIVFTAKNTSNNASFICQPNGALTWGGKGFVYDSTNQTIDGVKTFSQVINGTVGTAQLLRNEAIPNDGYKDLLVGTYGSVCRTASIRVTRSNTGSYNMVTIGAHSWTDGPPLGIQIQNWSGSPVTLFHGSIVGPHTNKATDLGANNNRWNNTYLASNPNVNSDERIKTSISVVPDAVLDAWGDVQWQQFKMLDAVAKKGENARLHNGLIAQRIDVAFRGHGLDASRYGLFCHDVWDAQVEEKNDDGCIITPERSAGDEYSVRYAEALCMEAAYQRRRADRAEARLTALERRLDEMEAAFAALGGLQETTPD